MAQGEPLNAGRIYQGVKRRLTRQARGIRSRVMFSSWLKKARPVLVYQMGKVGSTSVGRSLAATHPGVSVNTHDFFPDHKKWLVRRLYRAVTEEEAPLDVITLIREPVGRNISAFFENYERDTGVRYSKADFTIDELRELFLANYRHDLPLTWFEDHIERNFGIDVYDTPFPDVGFATYEKGGIRLLVMRVEIPDSSKEEVIRGFLELPEFQLRRANVGDEKLYADQYQAFKQQATLPADYLERMCSSRYFTHFYSQETIEQVRRRWSQ